MQVETCTITRCPLWPVRPIRTNKDRQAHPWSAVSGLLGGLAHDTDLTPEELEQWEADPRSWPRAEQH